MNSVPLGKITTFVDRIIEPFDLWCRGVVHNFIQRRLKSGSAQVQILLAACRRFVMVRISDNGPSFHRSTIPQKQFIIIIINITSTLNKKKINKQMNKTEIKDFFKATRSYVDDVISTCKISPNCENASIVIFCPNLEKAIPLDMET